MAVVYVGAFVFLLFKDRDALRSESFQLHKLAIERGLVGDNIVGLMKPDELTIVNVRAVQAGDTPKELE